jgi:NAD+ kinase
MMLSGKRIPRNLAIAAHPSLTRESEEVVRLLHILETDGKVSLSFHSIHDEALVRKIERHHLDCLLALGGDGTMMRATRLAAPHDVPVLGINLGHFGFLMDVQRQDWDSLLPMFLKGEFRLEQRILLQAELRRKGRSLGSWMAVNDVVVCRGEYVRPIGVKASVTGYELASYVADGLIVATPTGSTAYALAVGGPVMPPELRNILLIPIAPHRSLEHAVILSEGTCITLEVESSHQAVLSVDGQSPHPLENADQVQIGLSQHTASFVRLHPPDFFYRNLISSMVRNSHPEGER